MKKIMLLIIVGILFVGCSNQKSIDEENVFIDIKNPFDEREIIEQAMTTQKQILKPGFITKKSDLEDSLEVVSEHIRYEMKANKLEYQVGYSHTKSNAFISFLVKQNVGEKEYDEAIKKLGDSKTFKLDQLEGRYGIVEQAGSQAYQLVGRNKDQLLIYESGGGAKEGYDEAFTLEIAESLKTEEDGAYERFYEDFSLDLAELVFPMFHKNVVDDLKLEMTNIDYWLFEIPTFLRFTYYLTDPEVVFKYEIKGINEFEHMTLGEKVSEEETANGIIVSKYNIETDQRKIYQWKNNKYYYSIALDINEKGLSEEEIYQIIDLTFDDRRTFKNKVLFEAITTEPSFNEMDKIILKKLAEMKE